MARGIALRRIEPEQLDALPADDPRALRARRDLHRVNTVMLQPGVMRGLLARQPPPRWIIDLGGGDGAFMLQVARGLPWRGVRLTVVDRRPALRDDIARRFAQLGWRAEAETADAQAYLDALPAGAADLVTANLFLHHLQPAELEHLFATAARAAPCFAACEPRRSRLALLGSRLVFAVGCGPVTRYDAPVSVRAGFRDAELSALWPQPGWTLHERAARLFTHAFAARRDGAPA